MLDPMLLEYNTPRIAGQKMPFPAYQPAAELDVDHSPRVFTACVLRLACGRPVGNASMPLLKAGNPGGLPAEKWDNLASSVDACC